METINAIEFKNRIKLTGSISNVRVIDPIGYGIADHGNVSPNMTIRNCNLAGFHISTLQIDSLTFINGAVKHLQIETQSGIRTLDISKTNIEQLELVETNIGTFTLKAGQKKTSVTGRTATVVDTKISGNLKDFRSIDWKARPFRYKTLS